MHEDYNSIYTHLIYNTFQENLIHFKLKEVVILSQASFYLGHGVE